MAQQTEGLFIVDSPFSSLLVEKINETLYSIVKLSHVF